MQRDSLRLAGFLTDRVLVGPKRLSIKLTNRCNYACFYCGYHSKLINIKQPRKVFNIDFDVFKKIIDDAASLKTDEISLLGSGEPFLHAHIYEMIDYIKRKGLRLSILTNGTFDKKKIRSIRKVDYFIINFNSFNEMVFRKTQHGTAKNHQAVLENLEILSELKRIKGSPDTRLLFLIHKLNLDEISDVIHWAEQRAFDSLEFRLPFVRPEMKEFILDTNDMRRFYLILEALIKQKSSFLERTNIKFLYENFSSKEIEYQNNFGNDIIYYKQKYEKGFRCPAGWYYATIDITGNVYPCCHYRSEFCGGNIYQTGFKEIWLGNAFSDARKKMKHSFDISAPFWQRCHNCCVSQNLNRVFQHSKKFSH